MREAIDIHPEKGPQKKFVRYKEGAKLFSMSQPTFARIAIDAGALYRVGGITLVNIETLNKYLELFRVEARR